MAERQQEELNMEKAKTNLTYLIELALLYLDSTRRS